MKLADLFSTHLNEAKPRGPKNKTQRGQPASNIAGNDTGRARMERPDAISTNDRQGGTETRNTNANKFDDSRPNSRLAQLTSENKTGKCKLEFSDYFSPSFHTMSEDFDASQLLSRVLDFVEFKAENGNVPFTRYGEDKSSGVNLRGKTIKPYLQDQHWHCHLSLLPSGDCRPAFGRQQ